MNDQKILLVTGKGGVGKSLIAASAALRLSQQGKKVLLAEVGEKSFFQYWFDQSVGSKPVSHSERLWLCRWQGEDCLKEYIGHLLKVDKIVSLFFENQVMKALVQAAPALKELAILGKLTSGVRRVGPELPFDVIILDAYSTGHFKALLQAPRGMRQAIPLGPMGDQCAAIDAIIADPTRTAIWVVSLPEELPVTETNELVDFLREDLHLQSKIILNKVYPDLFSLQTLETLREQRRSPDDFLAFLTAKLLEQESARSTLKQTYAEVPFVPEATMARLLRFVSERIPDPWPLS